MKKIKIKIGKLFEELTNNSKQIDEIIKIDKKILIKSESGKLVNILGMIKKKKSQTYKLKFSHGEVLKCADKHLLKTDIDKFSFVKDLNIGDIIITKTGTSKLIEKLDNGIKYVYDISMKKEHVYTTPNGLIHHNTMLAIKTLGKGQEQYKGKLIGSFLDAEEATTTLRLSNLGVKYPKIKPYVDITVEKVFKFIEGLSVFKQTKKILETPSVVIWDSIANTLSEKERQTDDPNSVIGYKARLLSILVPKYLAKCSQNNICFLAINQLRDKLDLGMFGSPNDLKFMTASKTMPGGNVLKFNAFQLVEMKIKSIIAAGKAQDSNKYGFEGVIVKAKCVKNKLFPPNVEIELVGSFITGFSNFWTNYNFLKETKRLKTGAWNSLITLPEKKFRVKDAKTIYNTDLEFKEAWDKLVKETIQTEIIEKYNPEI